MTFKEYYTLHPELLDESPVRTGFHFDEPDIVDVAANIRNTKVLVSPLPVVGEYESDGCVLKCHREYYEKTKFQDHWVSVDGMTAVHFVFMHSGPGLMEGGVWQHKSHKGMARLLFFEFYLKHFSFIQSDSLHSTQGEKYWKKMADYGLKNGHRVVVSSSIGRAERDISKVAVDGLWSSELDYANLLIKIYAK